jgi:hypothetical protein
MDAPALGFGEFPAGSDLPTPHEARFDDENERMLHQTRDETGLQALAADSDTHSTVRATSTLRFDYWRADAMSHDTSRHGLDIY